MIRKKLQKIGGSVGLVLPRDLAAAAGLAEGDEVGLTLHGSRLVIEPITRRARREAIAASFDAVLERHGETFRRMAEFDRTGRRRAK
jgi:antitoxin component of MazEF toxin-antitoxin module